MARITISFVRELMAALKAEKITFVGMVELLNEKADSDMEIKTVPYQKCPVCDGSGRTPADGFTSAIYQTCRVCNGQMIIPMHILPTDYKMEHP